MRSTHLLGTAAILGTALLLASCAGSGDTGGSAATGGARQGTLVIAENEPPASFDPVQADNSTVDEVVIPAYDSLLTYDDDNQLAGELVTEWSVDDSGTVISLTLRDDVTFHDGAALTAADVVYTLDRIQGIGIGVASFLTAYDHAEAIDDTHVEITLSEADAPFLAALTRVYVVNSALVEENAGDDQGQSWLATNDAGSGPYTVTGYTPNQSATYAQYADYWGGFDGQAENIEFRYLTEASTQASALTSGDIDIAMDIAPADRAQFDTDGFVTDSSATNVVLYSFFNMADPTTSDPALREAISYAYDYQQHVDAILLGAGNTVNGPLPGGMQCSTTDDIGQPTFDLERAQQLVDDNGLAGTTVSMVYLEATTEMEQAATLLQSNLAEIGITLELQAVTYPQFVELYASDDTRPQMGMIYAFPAFPDASAILYQNFDSQFIGTGQNWGAYDNAEVDELLESAQRETDEDARCAQYLEAQETITGDFVSMNLANSNLVAVMSDRVEGYTYRASHHQTVDVYEITLAD
ncbi:ABC transporter substrate-binding protein [Microbacterium excoecariae]|uniref:ABC transporter substrate-binding protein n=1 Tax=Microbacterium excoecariae TaxID=2715210 RepID=UPI00140E9146|nr:ABC transporter substrate-binding protein [Microbacterium excoecariae]NHI17709.1 ABC transporter substrate-binding protein [Microbacterium excoecariae]